MCQGRTAAAAEVLGKIIRHFADILVQAESSGEADETGDDVQTRAKCTRRDSVQFERSHNPLERLSFDSPQPRGVT